MARKRGSADDGGGGGGEWLNTYADMVTLLLTFFILLFSMSSLDAAKFNMLVTAFASAGESSERIVISGLGENDIDAGGEDGGPDELEEEMEIQDIEEIFKALKQYIEDNQLTDSVELDQGEGYIFIRFMDDMLFEPNSSKLKTGDLEILNFVGMGIKSVQSQIQLIRIDGHTAAIPEDPNYPVSDRLLSSDRANAVLMYFEDTVGISPGKNLIAVGFGKHVPIADNTDLSERSKNRRVEIFISTENAMADQLNNIYEKLADE